MQYLALDLGEFHALNDGLTFKVHWDANRANFRFDFMSITEGKKTDPAQRNIYGSVHLKDLLPATVRFVNFDYFAQNATNLALITRGMGDGLLEEFRRSGDLVDLVGDDEHSLTDSRDFTAASKRIQARLKVEQNRLNALAYAAKRASYRIAFSNVTANTITLTASNPPAGATGDWDMQYRIEGVGSWSGIPSQSGENAHVFTLSGLRAGATYEFQVRQGTEPWSNTYKRIIPPQ